ncbi:MAG: class I SAM-dependent methyltransferase, partial [Planctomycetota bacterium]|nr:class I SAM-dependent methyltransferase [Planctomycetota bacterium]
MADKEPSSAAWTAELLADPHGVADKRARVRRMFAGIAKSYDLNNRVHSLWMDQRWRRRAVRLAEVKAEDVVVDVACGTGDLALRFAIELRRRNAECGMRNAECGAGSVIGLDYTFEMLPIS